VDYRVNLPTFAGPLDLLLHLVKRQEVDIHEVAIAQILRDFLGYLKALETLDLNNIGDFVVMASTLMEIKSRELLPRERVDLREELDPRDQLIQQLLEYRRYRDLTRRLERYGKTREHLLSRGSYGADQKAIREMAAEKLEREYEEALDLEDLDAWFLVKAYARLLEETDFGKTYAVEADRKPMAAYINELVERMESVGPGKSLPFAEAFVRADGKMGLIGTFMALLELLKQGRLRARQDKNLGAIVLWLVEPDRASEPEAPRSESRPEPRSESAEM